MRTTLVLDDDLLTRAKQRAAQDHRTVSDVVNQALRDLLIPSRATEATAPYQAVTFGDPQRPVAMDPAELAALDAADDATRAGF